MEATLSEPLPPGRRPARRPAVPSAVLGTLFFVVAEVMFFAGLLSAFTITRANQLPGMWPPPGQPVLPAGATALNTGFLLLSGVVLLVSYFVWRKTPALATWPMLGAWLLGLAFVVLQGQEWLGLLGKGLTLTSSPLGSFFYLIVGGHALHAVGALVVMAWACAQQLKGKLTAGLFFGVQTFWYFVVLMWPVIYARVYF
ncbi:MAG: cytochrome c oxidase subunit 3 [Myxococcota bacterium]